MTETPTLKSLLVRDLISFRPHTPIVEAVATLIEKEISGAPVVDETSALVGIITAKDCFRAALDASYYQGGSGIVADFMTREVQTLDAGLDLVSAAQRFIESPFRRFPLLEDGRLVGIIMRLDLLRALNAHLGGAIKS